MKSIFVIVAALALSGLLACKPQEKPVEFALDNAQTMKVTNIFNKDSVEVFYNLTGETNLELAEQYTRKAEEIIGADQKKALYYFKRAITLLPVGNIYARYGNALFEKGNYQEARNPFTMLIVLNPAQTKEQYLKIIKNELLSSGQYVSYALLENYKKQNYDVSALTSEVLEDEKIKTSLSVAQVRDFNLTIRNVWEMPPSDEDEENREGAPFSEYVKQFEPVTLPFNASKKELQRFVYDHSFEGEFEDYDASQDFTRFAENHLFKTKYYCNTDFQYLVKEGNGLVVLLHAADSSAEAVPGDFRCIYHRLLVFSTSGNLLDSKIIGIHSGETLVTYSINQELNINTESFSRKWKKPFVRHEIDNEILSTEKISEMKYKITESGKIQELPPVQ